MQRARTFHSYGLTNPEHSRLTKGGFHSAMTQPYVDLTDKRTSKLNNEADETSPYDNEFFRDMAKTIIKQFPVKDFAQEHNCSRKQVVLAIQTFVVQPLRRQLGQPDLGGQKDAQTSGYARDAKDTSGQLKETKETKETTETKEKVDNGDEKGWSWQNPKPIEPVVRRRVWQDEYGNYEPVGKRGRKESRRGMK